MFGLFGKKGSEGPADASGLRATIWIVQGPRLGEKWSLDEGEIKVGRGLEDPRAINFPDTAKFISSEHAAFRKDLDGYYVEDLGSKNGTFLNGKRVSARTRLSDSDEIEIGQVVYRVKIEQVHGEDADFTGELEVSRGTLQGQRMSLDDGELTVGRELEGKGVLSFPDTEKSISTEHAVLRKTRGAYWVQDLSSKNGTFVNGTQRAIAQLSDGDEIGMGDILFKVHIRKRGA